MLDNNQRAHDLACAIISNSSLTNTIVNGLPVSENSEKVLDVALIYKTIFDSALSFFEKQTD